MTTKQAIEMIHAPKGMTSIIQGVMPGDYSVIPHDKGKDSDLNKAKGMVLKYQQELNDCKSDWSYWSILGDLEYWKAIVSILEAGELAGHDNLPDVPAPNMDGLVVMDAISNVSEFGNTVLRLAKLKSAV
jgi:hypothetical protein